MVDVKKHILYFDEGPVIGISMCCNKFAVWNPVKGVHCPECKEKNSVSIFIWDGESVQPMD